MRKVNFEKGTKVRITSGSRKGFTGKLGRRLGIKGMPGMWSIHLDGSEWDAPGFGCHETNMEVLK